MVYSAKKSISRRSKAGFSDRIRKPSRSRGRRFLKLFFVVVIFLAAINFAIKLPGFISDFNKPFDNIQTNINYKNRINDNNRTNILFLSLSDDNTPQDLALASFNADKTSLVFTKIPILANFFSAENQQDVGLANAYFGKIYNGNDFDSLYLSSKELLAVPIDGYIILEVDNLEFSEKEIFNLKSRLDSLALPLRLLSYRAWLNQNMRTGYSIYSVADLALAFRNINNDKIIFTDLAAAVSKKQVDIDSVDNILLANNLETAIVSESALVEVVGENIHKTLVNRLINNIGANPIVIGEDGEFTETRVIQGSNKDKTANRIADFLNVKIKNERVESGADIRIELGTDLSSKLFSKQLDK